MDVNNKFSVGDKLEQMMPEGNQDIIIEHIENMHDQQIQKSSTDCHKVKIKLSGILSTKALLARYTS